ncbi:MAG TPA: DUF4136 domain-containing protein [Candidatus Polarisedimenticolia bacterium]|nr:DUF4136 domain-containing protein [Candidatus Polarisedimenticolia bacterium]
MHATARPGPERRAFLPVVAGLLLAFLPAGGPHAASGTAQTSIDFDGSTDFSQYKTYAWGQNTSSGNPVADEHIVSWIEAWLTDAGWTKVAAGEAQVIVAEHATVTNDTTVDTFYTGWGTGWGWTGFGPGAGASTTVSQTLRSGTLMIDMFDAGTKKLIWRGTAQGALSTKPEENYPKVEKIIGRLFKKFPPAPAAAAAPTTAPHKR